MNEKVVANKAFIHCISVLSKEEAIHETKLLQISVEFSR